VKVKNHGGIPVSHIRECYYISNSNYRINGLIALLQNAYPWRLAFWGACEWRGRKQGALAKTRSGLVVARVRSEWRAFGFGLGLPGYSGGEKTRPLWCCFVLVI
jgi:hypothetical protein